MFQITIYPYVLVILSQLGPSFLLKISSIWHTLLTKPQIWKFDTQQGPWNPNQPIFLIFKAHVIIVGDMIDHYPSYNISSLYTLYN